MEQIDKRSAARRRHLLTAEQLAPRPGSGASGATVSRGHGNGIRVHQAYIIAVSLAALILLVIAIVVAGTSM